jgi:hypothetical protein
MLNACNADESVSLFATRMKDSDCREHLELSDIILNLIFLRDRL